MNQETQELILELLDDGKSASEIVTILKEEYDTKISKSTVNRCRRLSTAFGDDKKMNDEEREIYLSYMQKKTESKEKQPWYTFFIPINRTPADGPPDPDMPEMSMVGHQNFLNNYIPQNSMQAIDVEIVDNKIQSAPIPFTAKTKSGIPTYPKFFWNPYTTLDYLVFQDVYTHTICGTIIDILVNFSVGLGIKPVLKLIDEDIDDKDLKDKDVKKQGPDGKPTTEKKKETRQEAIERLLDENKSLLDPLIAIDKFIGDIPNSPGINENWNTKIEALVRNHWIFGRDIMTMETHEKYVFEWDGTKYPNIRTLAKVQHPRDINFVKIDQDTQSLEAVSLMFSGDMVNKEDMIYLAHMSDSPIYNGKFYGYSLEQRMLGHGRSLRKLVDRDFPNVAAIGYAPFTIVAVKRDEKGTNSENTQNQAFLNTMVAGQPNGTTLNNPKDDLVVHQVDTDPKIREMIDMAHYHAEAAAKSAQVPTTLVSQEKDPNRDTLLGILRLFAEVEIPRKRLAITRVFTEQHYMVNWKEIYKDKSDVTEKFRVEAEFTDVKIDSWADIVGAFIELNKIFRFTADAAGEMLGIENLEGKIDPEKEPLGESNSFEDGQGNKLTMSKGPPKPKKST